MAILGWTRGLISKTDNHWTIYSNDCMVFEYRMTLRVIVRKKYDFFKVLDFSKIKFSIFEFGNPTYHSLKC